MNEADRERLRHMLAAAREAASFAEGRTIEDAAADRMLLLALVKELEILGEAASRISKEGRAAAPGIPWEKVTGMRNRLIHGYFDWDIEVIWSTLTSNLPDLIRELEKALADVE
jgi:uncharacterized protein with HEPN domain